jgi:hypothetical protein
MKNTNQHDKNDPNKVKKPVKEEWDQTDTRLAKYGQKSAETIRQILSGRIRHCPAERIWKLKLQVRHYLGQVGHCLVGPDIIWWEVSGNTIFSQNSPISY